VRIGVQMDLRNHPSWDVPWPEFYARALDSIDRAEAAGIESIWLTEHHFFDDGYLPQLLTFAAAIAARTERIRIGTAVLIAPLHAALEIAEQAAVVDLLSGGRLELGLGAGYRVPEFEAFGEDVAQRYPLLEARAAEIKRLWEQGGVTPAPHQPAAPLWIGAHGPRGARLAGRLGAGVLSAAPAVRAPYREALEEAGHGEAAARHTTLAHMIVSDDPDAAWPQIRPQLAYVWGSYARHNAEGAERGPARAATPLAGLAEGVDPDALRSEGPAMAPPAFDVVTPEECARRLRLWLHDVPMERVYFPYAIGAMPAELAERHVELLATEVAPAVAAMGRG
jgi:alkanesulfonate monooxygenase SsuD/methylene tetrahydromethanopterin reductase-like flavin-dependent oxidoreductase (luciferase family)